MPQLNAGMLNAFMPVDGAEPVMGVVHWNGVVMFWNQKGARFNLGTLTVTGVVAAAVGA